MEEVVKLLKEILLELKRNTSEIEDLKNLFIKYDTDMLMEDENLREG